MNLMITSAIEQARKTRMEYHAPIEGLPFHSMLIKPDKLDKIYILDYRDERRVKTILMEKTNEVKFEFNIYKAIAPPQDDGSARREGNR